MSSLRSVFVSFVSRQYGEALLSTLKKQTACEKQIGLSGYERYHVICVRLALFALLIGDCHAIARNDA
jgi:hypothetical protein